MPADPYADARAAAEAIRERLGDHRAALVLGSGWAGVAGMLGEERASVPMPELPGFPAPSVQGHAGTAHSVDAAGVPVLVLAGRAHLYEEHPPATVVHGVRAAVMAGCGVVLLTNAAGSIDPARPPGTPVVIRDHLNLTGASPMTGPEPPEGTPSRFCDLSDLYSPRLRAAAAAALPGVAEGVYAGLLGGGYETPAEVRMLRILGADLVGMSTVLEAIAARHLGAEVFGASLVTNLAAGIGQEALDHREVLAAGRASVDRLAGLLRAVIAARVTAGLRERARAWVDRDPDPATRAELEELLAAGDEAALAARFAGRLAFGTAGLRGEMGAGPARMNRLVVRESAAGIARHLARDVEGAAARGVVVGHDARHRSRAFAEDCAEVISANGIGVRLVAGPTPTPVAVFAIRRTGAAAGLVVTASHNPPADNGLKLFGADGAQIVPPVDGLVAAAIDAAAADGVLTPPGAAPAPVAPLDPAAVEAYRAAALSRAPAPAAPVRIATTAMHGVGGAALADLLAAAGHGDVHPVAEQEAPDPDFPTIAFPNPEEPGAIDMLAARMEASGAALGLALDPDADRLAALVGRRDCPPRQLTGDEVGALLGDWLLAEVSSGPGRLVVSSVVSSSLLSKVAARHGAVHAETLTGFKWLCRPAMEHPELTQVLAYEEALGYAIGADVRDKDGLTAALAVASMAAAEAARGRTLLDALDDLHARHGAHVTDNFSLRDDAPGGAARRAALVGRLAAAPPARLGSGRVRGARALAPDVLRIDLDGGLRVVVRPSGTEPKLKCYCEAVEPVAGGDVGGARARARVRLHEARAALAELVAP